MRLESHQENRRRHWHAFDKPGLITIGRAVVPCRILFGCATGLVLRPPRSASPPIGDIGIECSPDRHGPARFTVTFFKHGSAGEQPVWIVAFSRMPMSVQKRLESWFGFPLDIERARRTSAVSPVSRKARTTLTRASQSQTLYQGSARRSQQRTSPAGPRAKRTLRGHSAVRGQAASRPRNTTREWTQPESQTGKMLRRLYRDCLKAED